MDHQPLNTGEQKDMAEFFIDLVSKLEEMTPELKKLVKTLFCGVLSNNVVSLVSTFYVNTFNIKNVYYILNQNVKCKKISITITNNITLNRCF